MQKKPHADNLSRISSREKYSAYNPKKNLICNIWQSPGCNSYTGSNPVCIVISLSQHSINFDTKNKTLYLFTLILTALSILKFNMQRYYSLYHQYFYIFYFYISISSISIFPYFYISIFYFYIYIFSVYRTYFQTPFRCMQ